MENKCPSCHSTNIRNDSIRNNNGIIGPGCRSWVVEEKYSCNDCGVYFKPVTERYLNLVIAGHGKPERRGDATSPRWVKGTRNFPVKKPVIAKKFISYLNKEVVGTASSATGEMICFDWGVSSVCLAIGHEELNDLYWLDEQPAAVSQDAHEKEIMMQAFDKVRQIFEGRQWVMDGRGSYPYNDDRYQQEVRYMYDEFDQVVKDTWANIKSKSIEYREWIISEYLQKDHPAIPDILNRLGYQRIDEQPAAGREEDAVAFLAWIQKNDYYYSTHGGGYWYEWNEKEQETYLCNTNDELYKLFKKEAK